MNPKTARDIMVPLDDYPHAYESQTLREAVRLLETSEIHRGGRTSMPSILLVLVVTLFIWKIWPWMGMPTTLQIKPLSAHPLLTGTRSQDRVQPLRGSHGLHAR